MTRSFYVRNTALVVALIGTQFWAVAAAQSYPTKAVRLIVPLAAGGPVDTVTRIVAARLSEQLGQQVVVDNRPGAGGSVGGEAVARATPDGYTLLMAANGTIAIAPHLIKTLTYNAQRDFAPISLVGTSPLAMLVHPSLPVRNVKDFIALAKSRPGAINFGSSGNGSTGHLSSELFKSAAEVDLVHIPYRGAAPAMADVLAGQTQMIVTGVSSALPHIKSGKLRAIGVTSPKRIAVLPDVQAIAETVPGYNVTSWYGLFSTAGTPEPILSRLNQEMVKAVAYTEPKLTAAGVEAQSSTPEAFAAMIQAETTKWGKLIKALNITR